MKHPIGDATVLGLGQFTLLLVVLVRLLELVPVASKSPTPRGGLAISVHGIQVGQESFFLSTKINPLNPPHLAL